MINICVLQNLRKTLSINNVQEYVPAYNGESAGIDLYCATDKDITIYPSHYRPAVPKTFKNNILIPTGLKLHVPKGYVALIQERGSITKTNLKVRAGVIDHGYTGEVFVNCINTGESTHTFFKNSKLPFQLIVVKCDNIFNEVSEEEYLNLTIDSSRNEGKIGSSD